MPVVTLVTLNLAILRSSDGGPGIAVDLVTVMVVVGLVHTGIPDVEVRIEMIIAPRCCRCRDPGPPPPRRVDSGWLSCLVHCMQVLLRIPGPML